MIFISWNCKQSELYWQLSKTKFHGFVSMTLNNIKECTLGNLVRARLLLLMIAASIYKESI